jgi:predicted O-linked N-acetylglucosamine transferase (SPINDLY family)
MYQAALVLADIFETQERFEEAELQFLRAREIEPEHAGTLLNHGTFCFRRDRFDEAMQLFQRVKQLQPTFTDAESSLLFSTNFRTDLDVMAIADEHRRVGRLIAAASGPECTTWSNSPQPDRRLRIGYVSGDFLNHPIALFLRPVLEMRDLEGFEVYCYSNHNYPNPVADALRESTDHWRNIPDLDDRQVAEQIRKDEIDILVDLSGHTRRNRLSVFSRRSAPVQVSWLGYLNTTGLSTMDYRIVDRYTDPVGETEHLHTEKLVRMPHTQWCYAPWYVAPLVSKPHDSRPDALLFGSFNQFRKISDSCLQLWCEILRQLPESELLVLDVKNSELQTSFLNRIAHHGIDPARITMRQREAILEYFATIGNVDVALDTFPYNGATTTLDTLWMGVPVVGMRGDRNISRGTYSILSALGLAELIAKSLREFVDLNVRLARDAEWRARLRGTLRERLLASPLMDAAGFTRNLESCYRRMWRTWCAQQS